MSMSTWRYSLNGQIYGPVSNDVVRSLATQGVLGPMSNVLPTGSASWTPLYVHEATLGLRRTPADTYVLASGMPVPPTSFGPSGLAAAGPTATMPPPGRPQGLPPPTVPPPPPPGFRPVPSGVAPGARDYASWWSRVGAAVIDGILIAIPGIIVFLVVYGDELDESDSFGSMTGYDRQQVIFTVVVAVFTLTYQTLLHGTSGQTVGKRVLGIKVVDATTGEVIGLRRAFLRHGFTLVLSLVPLGLLTLLDGLWPLWDERNQTWHDKVVGSVVVDL